MSTPGADRVAPVPGGEPTPSLASAGESLEEDANIVYARGERRLRRRRVEDCTVDEALAFRRELDERKEAEHQAECRAWYLRGVEDGICSIALTGDN